ncbi:MAG: DUF1326 domain-containing protein [Candidatus Eremiobacteraeota bacterium]|nr:DUF1326 domain-containing protein [Candidatus Eremiobacteraeota bacterium]
MSTTESRVQQTGAAPASKSYVYDLQGTLLEACSCNVLCPCWIGEDPDTGNCLSFVAYNFDRGEINGVDVSGLTMINVCQIPGNVLVPKSWKVLILVNEEATDAQLQALLDAYSGKLGGPLADLAQLVAEVIGVERVKIRHDVRGGAGTLEAGDYLFAEMAPYKSADGTTTTLRDSIFSTIPGSPAYVSKAGRHEVNIPKYGLRWSFEGRNAIQGDYTIAHSG